MKTNPLYELKKDIREQFMVNVAKEYSKHKMSGNLVQSMRRRTIKRHGIVSVYIYAPQYDIWKYWYTRVIIPTGNGSYAEDNDAGSGGLKPGKGAKSGYVLVEQLSPKRRRLKMLPTHHHNDFVERNLIPAIEEILTLRGIKNFTIKTKG